MSYELRWNSARQYSPDLWKSIQEKAGSAPDGIVGSKTIAAVMRWQGNHGLVPDGLVGKLTLRGMGLEDDCPKNSKRRDPVREDWLGLPEGMTVGIDVSKWQGDVDWQLVAEGRTQFVIVKATEGRTYQDPKFKRNWEGAKKAGIPRGAYHFAHLVWKGKETDPRGGAQNFVDTVSGGTGILGELPLALDLETRKIRELVDLKGAAATRKWIEEWVEEFQELTGRDPMLYLSHRGAKSLGDERGSLPDLPTWWADYGGHKSRPPRRRPGWETWAIRQCGSNGRVGGIKGDCDINHLNPDFAKKILGV